MSTSQPDEATKATAKAVDDLPLLRGNRIRLRGFRQDDIDDVYALYSDPAVTLFWSFPAWTQRAQAEDLLQHAIVSCSSDKILCWAIADSGSDRLIGSLTLFNINRAQGRADIGYALHSGQWGKGYAKEALRLVLDYVFDTLKLRRVEADIDPRNTGSCKLVQGLGFRHEGLLRERWLVDDALQDSAIYGLLARDWHNQRRS
ncbi:MAG: GNAT family N-acetyltransferase [Lysobacter sp.]|nr:GNAT family N-acetyltransferase [Lysobacter sp.]